MFLQNASQIGSDYVGAILSSPRAIIPIILIFLHSLVFAPFPCITVYDTNGGKTAFPTHERQIVFVGSSTKIQSDLRKWSRELEKRPSLTKGMVVRGIAILPEWMNGRLSQPLALLYVRTHIPKQFHNSVYVYFASAEKARNLFDLPINTDEELHLFYLNNAGNILVYTYGAPSNKKINLMSTFSGRDFLPPLR